MENKIWQTDSCKMYIKFINKYFDHSTPTPFASFIIGVELKLPSWVGGELLYRAEDGFHMQGNYLLNELGRLVNSYEIKEFRIKDDYGDTDAYVLFNCKLDCIEISGQLGSSFSNNIVSKFNFRANASLIYNLYEVLKENTIY